MTHALKAGPVTAAELKQKLAETETARRELLLHAFVNYPSDNTEILRFLFLKAAPETIAELESVLTKGGV